MKKFKTNKAVPKKQEKEPSDDENIENFILDEDADEEDAENPEVLENGDEGEENDEEEEEELRKELMALARSKFKTQKTQIASDNDTIDNEEELQKKKEYKNNVMGIIQKMDEFKWKDLEWKETLALTSKQELTIAEEDVNNDRTRELAFYQQALEAVNLGIKRLDQLNIKHRRPTDYFAEMVKSDIHMTKVRQKLITDKKRIETSEEKRRTRELKKVSKKVQIEKQLERQKEKRENLDAIKKWRKSRGDGIRDDADIDNVINPKKRKRDNEPNEKSKKTKTKGCKIRFWRKEETSKREHIGKFTRYVRF